MEENVRKGEGKGIELIAHISNSNALHTRNMLREIDQTANTLDIHVHIEVHVHVTHKK